MSSPDELRIQEADVRRLRSAIDEEINQVEEVRRKCVEACNENPADDDFFKYVEITGQTLEENWNNLISTFKSIGSELDNLIAQIGRQLADAIEKLLNVGK